MNKNTNEHLMVVSYVWLYDVPLCSFYREHKCNTREELERVLKIIIDDHDHYKLISVMPDNWQKEI